MKTADLNASHLYLQATIAGPDWRITGTLRTVEHGAAEITEVSLGEAHETVIPGQRYVRLAVGPFEFNARGDEEVSLTHPPTS